MAAVPKGTETDFIASPLISSREQIAKAKVHMIVLVKSKQASYRKEQADPTKCHKARCLWYIPRYYNTSPTYTKTVSAIRIFGAIFILCLSRYYMCIEYSKQSMTELCINSTFSFYFMNIMDIYLNVPIRMKFSPFLSSISMAESLKLTPHTKHIAIKY